MKLLHKLFDSLRPTFTGGGKLGFLKQPFETAQNVLLGNPLKAETAPHARDPIDLKRYMSVVIAALTPSLLAGIYFFGLRVLAVVAVSYIVGGIIEVIFAIVRDEEINEGFLVTGLIYPLVLPPGLPLWAVGLGVAFGVIVGKELFGGTGRNLFNPALLGRCFLALSYAKVMVASYLKPALGGFGNLFNYVSVDTVDAVSGATPLSAAKSGTMAPMIELMVGNVGGSIGETSAIAIVAGGALLLFSRVANYRTVFGSLGAFAALGALLHSLVPATFGPVQWHLAAGGLLFGTFFMATDPVTSPATNGAKWAYGIFIGAATVLIRNLTGYVEGMMFAILLGNIIAPVLDEVVIRMRLRENSLMKSNLYTVVYAIVVGGVCSILLTGAGRFTAERRAANEKAEEYRNIFGVLGVAHDGSASAKELLKIFDKHVRVEQRGELSLFHHAPGGNPEAASVAVRIRGAGVWGPMHGFLALSPDFDTIRGLTFYKQEETPGLGGEIGAEWWLKKFVGKSTKLPSGEPGIKILRGSGAKGDSEVDGISGATMTCNKVQSLLNGVIAELVEEK